VVWFFSFGFSRHVLGYFSQVEYMDVVLKIPHRAEVFEFPQNL